MINGNLGIFFLKNTTALYQLSALFYEIVIHLPL